MEHEKKLSPTQREQGLEQLPGAATCRQASPVVQSSAMPPRMSMVSVVDALFDLNLNEKHGGKPGLPPAALADMRGLEHLIAILGPCVIPGCDVHLLSREKGVGRLEGGGFGVGMKILTHLETSSSVEPTLARARAYWSSPHPAAVAVMVYTDGERVLMVDGTETPLR